MMPPVSHSTHILVRRVSHMEALNMLFLFSTPIPTLHASCKCLLTLGLLLIVNNRHWPNYPSVTCRMHSKLVSIRLRKKVRFQVLHGCFMELVIMILQLSDSFILIWTVQTKGTHHFNLRMYATC